MEENSIDTARAVTDNHQLRHIGTILLGIPASDWNDENPDRLHPIKRALDQGGITRWYALTNMTKGKIDLLVYATSEHGDVYLRVMHRRLIKMAIALYHDCSALVEAPVEILHVTGKHFESYRERAYLPSTIIVLWFAQNQNGVGYGLDTHMEPTHQPTPYNIEGEEYDDDNKKTYNGYKYNSADWTKTTDTNVNSDSKSL